MSLGFDVQRKKILQDRALFARIFFGLIVIMAVLSPVADALAAPELRSRIAGSLGIGQAGGTSADGRGTASEGPLNYGISLDYAWKTSYFIFVEHFRSYSDGSSGIGVTGIGLKFYPWLSPVEARGMYSDSLLKSLVSTQGYSYYFGSSVGLAQASVPAVGRTPATIAVGPCVGLKAGTEYGLNREWALRSEFNLDLTVSGAGSVQFLSLSVGFSHAL